mgnify:CR=1 FL=1
MGNEVHLLILENEPADAELIERELRKEHIPFTATRVETQHDFTAELTQNPPDLVLVDYNLPEFDGISALHEVQQIAPHIPVIIVTGVLSEESAALTIKAGAVGGGWDQTGTPAILRHSSAHCRHASAHRWQWF